MKPRFPSSPAEIVRCTAANASKRSARTGSDSEQTKRTALQQSVFYTNRDDTSGATASDDALTAGRIHLAFPERTDPVRIPGKSVESHTDSVFSKQVGDIFKQNVQMTGEKTGFRTGRLAKQIVDSPYTDRIISVKRKRRSIRSNIGPPEIAGRIAKPASSVVPLSSCPQSLPASESFPMSQHFA